MVPQLRAQLRDTGTPPLWTDEELGEGLDAAAAQVGAVLQKWGRLQGPATPENVAAFHPCVLDSLLMLGAAHDVVKRLVQTFECRGTKRPLGTYEGGVWTKRGVRLSFMQETLFDDKMVSSFAHRFQYSLTGLENFLRFDVKAFTEAARKAIPLNDVYPGPFFQSHQRRGTLLEAAKAEIDDGGLVALLEAVGERTEAGYIRTIAYLGGPLSADALVARWDAFATDDQKAEGLIALGNIGGPAAVQKLASVLIEHPDDRRWELNAGNGIDGLSIATFKEEDAGFAAEGGYPPIPDGLLETWKRLRPGLVTYPWTVIDQLMRSGDSAPRSRRWRADEVARHMLAACASQGLIAVSPV